MRTSEKEGSEKVMARVGSLTEGEFCKTKSGKYLQQRNWGYQDELGRTYIADWQEECELLSGWPVLQEGEGFQLISKLDRALPPHQVLTFETNANFKFRVRMINYRITIPFEFSTKDERVEKAKAEWSARSGKIVAVIEGHPLHIIFDEVPKLHVGFSGLVIPKQ